MRLSMHPQADSLNPFVGAMDANTGRSSVKWGSGLDEC